MKLWLAVLLLFMLGVSSSCSIPAGQEKKERVDGVIEAGKKSKHSKDASKSFTRVSFRVLGMMKTKSGAT